jgi:hypothetical protein
MGLAENARINREKRRWQLTIYAAKNRVSVSAFGA